MRDYYRDGYDKGYGRKVYNCDDYPETWGEQYDYNQGVVDGQRGKEIVEELREEGW